MSQILELQRPFFGHRLAATGRPKRRKGARIKLVSERSLLLNHIITGSEPSQQNVFFSIGAKPGFNQALALQSLSVAAGSVAPAPSTSSSPYAKGSIYSPFKDSGTLVPKSRPGRALGARIRTQGVDGTFGYEDSPSQPYKTGAQHNFGPSQWSLRGIDSCSIHTPDQQSATY